MLATGWCTPGLKEMGWAVEMASGYLLFKTVILLRNSGKKLF